MSASNRVESGEIACGEMAKYLQDIENKGLPNFEENFKILYFYINKDPNKIVDLLEICSVSKKDVKKSVLWSGKDKDSSNQHMSNGNKDKEKEKEPLQQKKVMINVVYFEFLNYFKHNLKIS